MRLNYILSALGLVMMFFGAVILVPIIIAIAYQDYSSIVPFISASLISIITGYFFRRNGGFLKNFNDLKKTEGLFIVVLTWSIIALITSIPYLFFGLTPLNAIFEAVSGVTTTGATIVTDFSLYPKTFFFWRSMSQWLGGMGIIVLFIAILPQFAVAGRQMFFAEAPGPTEEKITPRIRHTATALWSVYIILTVLEIIALYFAGMPLYDAICNSFSTIAAGGFSPNPESIMGYNSSLITWIIIVFMFFAGANFALSYKVLFQRKLKAPFRSDEFKFYFYIIAGFSALLASMLILDNSYNIFESITDSVFQIISIITTTGFASFDFENWSVSAKSVLFTMMFVGGCAGSAGGGVKVVRVLFIFKYLKREIAQILHPRAVLPIKFDKNAVSHDILRQIIGFILFYFFILIISSITVSVIEGSMVIGLTGTAATIGNIGPGFGIIGPMGSFNDLSAITKLIFIVNMLVGRLELIPFLAMLHPDFWIIKTSKK